MPKRLPRIKESAALQKHFGPGTQSYKNIFVVILLKLQRRVNLGLKYLIALISQKVKKNIKDELIGRFSE